METRSRTISRRQTLLAVLVVGIVLAFLLKLPHIVKLEVPFVSQAPQGDWSEPWQNACEETSVYMVARYYQHEVINETRASQDILEILATKNAHIGASHDESMATVSQLVRELGHFTARVVRHPTFYGLKWQLARGRPVIVPVYAPILDRKYDGQVDYHVLVLTGYDDAALVFIANDPGTADGEGVEIPYAQLLKAIHDLHEPDMAAGEKRVLYTSPK